MTHSLSREELKNLLDKQVDPSVSIFMPAFRAGKEVEQNAIRFKNLLRKIEGDLSARGLRSLPAEKMLQPAAQLLSDSFFWNQQSEGLAVFFTPEEFYHYRLPLKFEELAVVSRRFHLKPLLPLLSGDGRFYILALSQNQVKMLQGTRFSVSEIELKEAPKNLEEALKYDITEKQLQFHTRAPEAKGERAAMFHGHGAGGDDAVHKKSLLQYFQQVNAGAIKLLGDERAPLVLAGVDYLFPIYREANSYRHLLDEGIAGNPEALSAEALHQKAWALVESHFLKDRRADAARYQKLAGTARASQDLKKIVAAAQYSRIEFLFVTIDVQAWGKFDAKTSKVEIHPQAESGDEDLLDLAAIQTFLNGGSVYAVEARQMPAETEVAAVFRY